MLAIFPLFIRSDLNVCIDQTEEYNNCPTKNYQIINNTDDLYHLLENTSSKFHLITFLTGEKILKLPVTENFPNNLIVNGNDANIILQNPNLFRETVFEFRNLTLDVELDSSNKRPSFKAFTADDVIFTNNFSEISVTGVLSIDVASLRYLKNVIAVQIILNDIKSPLDQKVTSTITDVSLQNDGFKVYLSKNTFNMKFTDTLIYFKNEIINYTITMACSKEPTSRIELSDQSIDATLNLTYHRSLHFFIQISVSNQAKLHVSSSTSDNVKESLEITVQDSYVSFDSGLNFPLILNTNGNSTIFTQSNNISLKKIDMQVGALYIDAPPDTVFDMVSVSMQDFTSLISKNSFRVFVDFAEFKGNKIYSSDEVLWDVESAIEVRDANVSIANLKSYPDLKILNRIGLLVNYTGIHIRNPINYLNWNIEMRYSGSALPTEEKIHQHINQTYNAFCAKNNICKDHLYNFETAEKGIKFEPTCRQIDDDYCIGGYYSDDPRMIDLHICYAYNIKLCAMEDYSYFCTVSNISDIKNYVQIKTNNITYTFKSTADVAVGMGDLPISDFDLEIRGFDQSYIKFDVILPTFNKLRNLKLKSTKCEFNILTHDNLITPQIDSITMLDNSVLLLNDRDFKFDMSHIKSFWIDQTSLKNFKAYNGTMANCSLQTNNISISLMKNSIYMDGNIHSLSRIKSVLFICPNKTILVNVSLESTFSDYATINFAGNPKSEININFLNGFDNIPSMKIFNITSIGKVFIRSSSLYLPLAITNCNGVFLSTFSSAVSLQSLTVDNFNCTIKFPGDNKNRTLTFQKLIINGTSSVSCEFSTISDAIVEELIMDKFATAHFAGLKFTNLVSFSYDTTVSFSNCDISKMKIASIIENNSVADIALRDADIYEMVPPMNHFVIFKDFNFDPSKDFVIVDAYSNQLSRLWVDSVKIDPKVVKLNGVKYYTKTEVSNAVVKVVLSSNEEAKLSTVHISLIAGSVIFVFLSIVVAVFLVINYKKKRLAAMKTLDSNLLFEIQ